MSNSVIYIEILTFPLVSWFQAILFYVPRWLWKNWEAGKIHALMMDLDIGVVQDVEKRQKKRLLLDYLADNLKHHNWWAYRYFFCEFLALVNIVGKNKPSLQQQPHLNNLQALYCLYLCRMHAVVVLGSVEYHLQSEAFYWPFKGKESK